VAAKVLRETGHHLGLKINSLEFALRKMLIQTYFSAMHLTETDSVPTLGSLCLNRKLPPEFIGHQVANAVLAGMPP